MSGNSPGTLRLALRVHHFGGVSFILKASHAVFLLSVVLIRSYYVVWHVPAIAARGVILRLRLFYVTCC